MSAGPRRPGRGVHHLVDRPDRDAGHVRPARRVLCCTAPGARRGRSSGTPPRRLQAAAGIARNTANITALDATIGVASDMLGAAGAVERKLDTVATVLEERCR